MGITMRDVLYISLALGTALLYYAVRRDMIGTFSWLFLLGLIYLVSLKPQIGGPILYGLFGFLLGFAIALAIGLTLPLSEKVKSSILALLLVLGPLLGVYVGKKRNYSLWWSLKP
jgi:hypothetical protein